MLEEQLADVSKQLHKNYNSFKLNNKFLETTKTTNMRKVQHEVKSQIIHLYLI